MPSVLTVIAARLDQQVGDADRDQVGGADGEQRQQRQQRRPVDDQQQDQDQAEGRDQQRLAGFVGDLLEVGGDPAGPGHVGAEPGHRVGGEVARGSCATPSTIAPRSAASSASTTSAASPSREIGPMPLG